MIANGTEEVECLAVVDLLRRSGVETVLVSVEESCEVTSSHKVRITADTTLAQTDLSDGDVIFLPGGMPGAERLSACEPLVEALEQAFAQHHSCLNCLLVEPLLQGAGGMRMYDRSFLERARELCDQYGVLLIFDEVATGFGRTGNRFVADLVLPDILVLGKALTGGYIGHAVTVANHKVYQGFYSDDPDHALMLSLIHI